MMPEFFGSLSDKHGPLCAYLKFHSWNQYRWSPDGLAPQCPEGFYELEWRYLSPINNPRAFIEERMASLDNQRIRLIRAVAAPLTQDFP